jgi:hypothetical protein
MEIKKKPNTETTQISTTSIHLRCLRKCITVNTTFIRINIEISDDTKTMYICIYIYPAMTAFTDQYSLPNIFFDIGQL